MNVHHGRSHRPLIERLRRPEGSSASEAGSYPPPPVFSDGASRELARHGVETMSSAVDPTSTNPSPRDPSRTGDTHEHPSCAACRSLDARDGVEDGQMFTPLVASRIGDEKAIVRKLQRAQDRAADQVTAFAGSLNFVYIHSVWFGIWILINIGLVGSALQFDKFPFGLLTMIVSLEAIFLATFVMVSQNRQSARADIRSQLDFETNVRAEIWAVHIGAALGIDDRHVEDVVQHALAAQNQ